MQTGSIALVLLALSGCSPLDTVERNEPVGSTTIETVPDPTTDCVAVPEVCDGVDNDCDGEVDEGATDARTFFADTDSDGFGDENSPAFACAVPEGHVDNDQDCDDTRDDVNPDALEICDGIDNDCDASSAEAGLATFFDAAGTVDFAGELVGTAEEPSVVALDLPGLLQVCEGTWFVRLTIDADVDIIGPAGADATRLDGGAAGAVLQVSDGSLVDLQGLTVQNGQNTLGGGVVVDAGAVLTGEDLVFRDNESQFGGAMLTKGAVTLRNSTLHSNLATAAAPAVYVDIGGAFTFENTIIRDNGGSGQSNKPVIRVRPDGALSCVTSQLFGNTQAVAIETDGTAIFDDCDFVDPITNEGNGPADITFDNADDLTDLGLGFTATCDVNGCVAP